MSVEQEQKSELAELEAMRVAGMNLDEWVALNPKRIERWVRFFASILTDVVFRLKTYGAERLPTDGPYLFCPNHSSYMDPFAHARGQKRVMRYMAKASLFKPPVVRWIMRNGGGFPVFRGMGDKWAMELAKRLLLAGWPVTIYPEGTRYRNNNELGPPKSGAARLVLETRVPVIPVASWGTRPRKAHGIRSFPWRLPKITTMYGYPLHFDHLDPTPENIELVRNAIWEEVQRIYEVVGDVHPKWRRPRHLKLDPPDPSRSAILANALLATSRGGAVR